MNKEAAITLKELEIGYTHNRKNLPIMGALNATLYKGELVALIGKNGAGKSTLMRTLSAFQTPLGGTITYPDGKNHQRKASELSTILAVVLTDNSSINNMSVREVVALGRTPYNNFLGYNRKRDEEIIDKAIERMGISSLAQRNISTLSDGERQKTMIAKALAQETPIILLDEPTAFLDFKSRIQLFRELKKLASETNKAILVSTHDLELILQIADRIWLIHDNKMFNGSINELSKEGVLTNFIDSEGIHYNTVSNRIEIV